MAFSARKSPSRALTRSLAGALRRTTRPSLSQTTRPWLALSTAWTRRARTSLASPSFSSGSLSRLKPIPPPPGESTERR